MAEFGELMAELRQDRGLTQKELGKILSVSTGTISNYENGVHHPDLEKLVQLADFFQVSTDYLLGRKDYAVPTQAPNPHLPQDAVLVQMVHSLSHLPEDRRLALALIIRDLEQHAQCSSQENEGDK